jgi:hypothetical protein
LRIEPKPVGWAKQPPLFSKWISTFVTQSSSKLWVFNPLWYILILTPDYFRSVEITPVPTIVYPN